MELLKSYDACDHYSMVFELPEDAADMYDLVSMARRVLNSGVFENSLASISSSRTGEVRFFKGGDVRDIYRFDMVSIYGEYHGIKAGVGFHFYEDKAPALSVSVFDCNRSSCFMLSKDIALAIKGRFNAFDKKADALCVSADH